MKKNKLKEPAFDLGDSKEALRFGREVSFQLVAGVVVSSSLPHSDQEKPVGAMAMLSLDAKSLADTLSYSAKDDLLRECLTEALQAFSEEREVSSILNFLQPILFDLGSKLSYFLNKKGWRYGSSEGIDSLRFNHTSRIGLCLAESVERVKGSPDDQDSTREALFELEDILREFGESKGFTAYVVHGFERTPIFEKDQFLDLDAPDDFCFSAISAQREKIEITESLVGYDITPIPIRRRSL